MQDVWQSVPPPVDTYGSLVSLLKELPHLVDCKDRDSNTLASMLLAETGWKTLAQHLYPHRNTLHRRTGADTGRDPAMDDWPLVFSNRLAVLGEEAGQGKAALGKHTPALCLQMQRRNLHSDADLLLWLARLQVYREGLLPFATGFKAKSKAYKAKLAPWALGITSTDEAALANLYDRLHQALQGSQSRTMVLGCRPSADSMPPLSRWVLPYLNNVTRVELDGQPPLLIPEMTLTLTETTVSVALFQRTPCSAPAAEYTDCLKFAADGVVDVSYIHWELTHLACKALIAWGKQLDLPEVFGKSVGCCWYCGNELTDETSKQRGVGADCYEQYHLPLLNTPARGLHIAAAVQVAVQEPSAKLVIPRAVVEASGLLSGMVEEGVADGGNWSSLCEALPSAEVLAQLDLGLRSNPQWRYPVPPELFCAVVRGADFLQIPTAPLLRNAGMRIAMLTNGKGMDALPQMEACIERCRPVLEALVVKKPLAKRLKASHPA